MIIHRLHQTEIRKFQLHKTTRLVHWSSQCLRILCFQQQRKQFGNNGEHIYGPGVDSASNRNEYQEYFLGGKGGRCVRLTTLPPSCAVVMKSGNLDFLEPSGPVQACNGIAYISIWRYVGVNNSMTGLDRPWGFQEVEATIFQDNWHMKVVRLSALCTGRFYHSRNIPGTRFC